MRDFGKTSMMVTGMAALVLVATVVQADACSRIVAITDGHGVIVSRTLDWSKTLGEIAEVSVVGQERTTRSKGRYKNPAKWKVKYQTLSFVEQMVFDYTTSEAINTEGLSASVLYMAGSEEFQQGHKDNGAPAVNLNNLSGFLVENYASVQEALDAKNAGKWQVAWAETMHVKGDKIHGLHFAIQDKTGHIALFQYTDIGEVIYDNKKKEDEDIKVMTNDPLLWKQRVFQEYIGKNNIRGMDAGISAHSRHQRLTAYLEAQKFDPKLSRSNIDAKVTLVMDTGGSVPYDLIDETTGETYQTQMKIQYHFDTGDISFKNYQVDEQMRFNIKDILKFKKPMFADLMKNLADGFKKPQWQATNPAK